MVIFIPRNVWVKQVKQLIRFSGQSFSFHKTYHFKPKLVLQVEQTTELSMLVLDLTVKCRLKILNGIFVESMECLNEDA